MSRFEFLMMIAAVVVAIGMTEIVGGWGRWMRTRAAVRFDWLHIGFSVLILSSLIQYWVGMWSYSELNIDRLGQIFFLIVPSLFGVLSAFAITPNVPEGGQLDLREYYFAKRFPIFLPLAAYYLTALLADVVIVGMDSITLESAIPHVEGPALIALLLITRRLWVHTAVLIFWAGSLSLSLLA